MQRAIRLFSEQCLWLAAALLWLTAGIAVAQEAADGWYEQDRINSGLAAPPDSIDRSTPRTTMRGFLRAASSGRAEVAAHFLNLAEIEPERQAGFGPEIARKLSSIIERQVWIDWTDLSTRPDAMIEAIGSSDPRAGQVRRNLSIATLEADGTAYDIRLARYKAPEAEAVWLFTPQTIRNVGPLYEVFGPKYYEQFIPQSLKTPFLGLWLWEWIALPLAALFTLLLGWLSSFTVTWLSNRSGRAWLSTGLERSALPLAILVMAGTVQMLLSWVLTFSGPVNAILRPLLTVLMVWGFGMALLRIIDAILNRITLRFIGEIDDKRSADERELYTSIYALRRLIVLLMVGFAAVVALSQLNLFDSIGMTLLASAGVLTVVFGIAGQAVLGNIMASLQIAFAKPVRIGDSVLFEGDWAYVEAIFYTFLRLRTWDHRRIVVPVTYFVSRPFENWSVTEARMMKVIKLRLDHRADVEELRKTFDRMVHDDPDVLDPDDALTYATEQNADGFEISFYAMMPDPSTGWAAQSRLREQLMAHIRENHPDWWPRERVMDADGTTRRGALE